MFKKTKLLQQKIILLNNHVETLICGKSLLYEEIDTLEKKLRQSEVSHDKICQDIRKIAKERDDLKAESNEKTEVINSLLLELSKPSIKKTVVNIASITIN